MNQGEVYLKNTLEGMNNDELILFIYQEMLKVLNQTLFYFDKNQIEQRVTAINKGIEVLNALLSILNFEQGGEIAARLRSLYLYCIKRLTAANYDKDPHPVTEVIKIFKNLHDGWAEKIEKDKKENIQGAAANNPFNSPLSPSMPSSGTSGDEEGGALGGLELYG